MNVCRMAWNVKDPLCPRQKYIKPRLALSCGRRIGGSCHINTIVLLVIKAASICSELWLWLAPVEKDVHQSECCSRQRSVGSVAWSRGGTHLYTTRDSRYERYHDVERRTTAGRHSTLFIATRSTSSFRCFPVWAERVSIRSCYSQFNIHIQNGDESVCWCCVFGGHLRKTCWTLNRSFA